MALKLVEFFTVLCLFPIISIQYTSSTKEGKQCLLNDSHSCTCNFTDGSGIIDLRSLGNKNNTARFKDIKGADGFFYSYNPCYGFMEGACDNAAMCVVQNSSQKQIGDAGTATFQYVDEENDVLALYVIRQFGAASIVRLTCDSKAREPVFKAFGELTVGFYSFQLTSVCACPGMCTETGPADVIG